MYSSKRNCHATYVPIVGYDANENLICCFANTNLEHWWFLNFGSHNTVRTVLQTPTIEYHFLQLWPIGQSVRSLNNAKVHHVMFGSQQQQPTRVLLPHLPMNYLSNRLSVGRSTPPTPHEPYSSSAFKPEVAATVPCCFDVVNSSTSQVVVSLARHHPGP